MSAPEILIEELEPLIVRLARPLTSLVKYLVVLGIITVYRHTFGALLEKLGSLLNISIFGHRILHIGALDSLDHNIMRALSDVLFAYEVETGAWFAALAEVQSVTDRVQNWALAQVYHGFLSLVHGVIPKTITTVVSPVKTDLGALRRALRAEALHLEVQLAHRAHAIEATMEHDFGLAWKGIDAVPRKIKTAIAGALGIVDAGIIALRHHLFHIFNRRLTRLEKLVLGGAFSATVLAVLTRVWPWWKCTNVRRAMRGVCRMDRGLIDLLLGVGLEAAVLVNICQSVKLFTGIAHAFEPELRGLVAVTGAALECATGDAAGPMGGNLPALPSGASVPLDLPV